MASTLFSEEDYEMLKKLLQEKSLLIPHIDVAKEGGEETIYGFKVRTGRVKEEWGASFGRVEVEWDEVGHKPVFHLVCAKCNHPISLHNGNKCPTVIDAEFKEDEPPLLSSGE